MTIEDLKNDVNAVHQFCKSRIRTQFPNGNGKLACKSQEHGCKLSVIFKRDAVSRDLVTVTSWVPGTCITPLTGASVPLPKRTREPKAFASFFKGFCTCVKSQCRTLNCKCRNAGVACNKLCKCNGSTCQHK
jgi:hypothetical protein